MEKGKTVLSIDGVGIRGILSGLRRARHYATRTSINFQTVLFRVINEGNNI
jgi:hypothetical protein